MTSRETWQKRAGASSSWRKTPGDVGGANVPADVARKLVLRQAEITEPERNPATGMVAEQKNRGLAAGVGQLDNRAVGQGGRAPVGGRRRGRRQALEHRHSL